MTTYFVLWCFFLSHACGKVTRERETFMNDPRDKQLERLFFIEYLAIFVGKVSRRDLVQRFGISEPAATKDFSLYTTLAPSVLRYDLKQKCYVLSNLAPIFEHHVEQSLQSLAGDRAIRAGNLGEARLTSWITGNIRRQLSLDIASAITRSIYLGLYIDAEYLSLSSGVSTRRLSPVALVNDGLRWHTRCFDHVHRQFRDFSLTRFSSVNTLERSPVTIDQDSDWNDLVSLELVPHPKASHPEAIHVDFDLCEGAKRIQLRRCLVGYFLKHWHVDTTHDASKNPNASQLYLRNRDELVARGVPEWAFI